MQLNTNDESSPSWDKGLNEKPWRQRAANETGNDLWLEASYLPHGFEPTEREKKRLHKCDSCGRWTERYYPSSWGRTCKPCSRAA